MAVGKESLLLFLLCLKCDAVYLVSGNSSEIQYNGDKFPTKYLLPEEFIPRVDDLKLYIKSLKRTVHFFNKYPNKTDCNVALGAFFTKALLKRTVQDYNVKLPRREQIRLLDITSKCENIVSHFIYKNNPYGFDDIEFRVSRVFKDDNAQTYSIGEFKKGRMNRWLYSNFKMNNYAEDMDTLSFPKLKYVKVTTRPREYYINADDSDQCISRVVYEPEPINLSDLKMCKPDKFCFKRLHSSPSVSYTLSHRLLNIMLRRHVRRCYLRSAEEDESLMELLCAFMYREAVYLARRGFFARDIFLEHIALCGMLGYEEFHRSHWFNKAVSWMNQRGCIKETRNLEYNMTRVQIERMGENDPRAKILRRELRRNVNNECHFHPMALLMVVFGHGIRYVH
ncbi:unnamed protein product, partial [Iphiclides podalirius]